MRPRLLMLTHRAPYPLNRGDRIRSYHLLRELSGKWRISLGCVNDEPITASQELELSRHCEQLAIEEVGRTRWLRAIQSAATGSSLTEGYFCSRRLRGTIKNWVNKAPFDCVLVYCSSMLQYTTDPGLTGTPIVSDLVDVDSEKWRELSNRFCGSWKKWLYAFEAKRVHDLERKVVDRSEAITLVSEDEAQLFLSRVSQRKTVLGVGNGVDVDFFAARKTSLPKKPVQLTFVGVLNYLPNVQGITWFVEEVFPRIQTQVNCSLDIVGRTPAAEVLKLAESQAGVAVHADVPDVRKYLDRSDVVVAPLQLARGIQNKVLEAMACGKPVVLCAEASLGVDADDGKHFFIGRTADEFSKHVVRLAKDEELRKLSRFGCKRTH